MALFFFALIFGTIDFFRWMSAINGAAEATREGARAAVVCGNTLTDQANVKQRMRNFLLLAKQVDSLDTHVTITYTPAGCAAVSGTGNHCQRVAVELSGMTVEPISPYLPATLPLPPTRYELPREAMSSAGNARCLP